MSPVVFTFDEVESLRTSGQPRNRNENLGYRYNIPTTVLPQAYDATNLQTSIWSYAYTDDPEIAARGMDFYYTYYGADVYDFSAALDRIAHAQATPTVTTAGGTSDKGSRDRFTYSHL